MSESRLTRALQEVQRKRRNGSIGHVKMKHLSKGSSLQWLLHIAGCGCKCGVPTLDKHDDINTFLMCQDAVRDDDS